jgi:hypothetical protein
MRVLSGFEPLLGLAGLPYLSSRIPAIRDSRREFLVFEGRTFMIESAPWRLGAADFALAKRP